MASSVGRSLITGRHTSDLDPALGRPRLRGNHIIATLLLGLGDLTEGLEPAHGAMQSAKAKSKHEEAIETLVLAFKCTDDLMSEQPGTRDER